MRPKILTLLLAFVSVTGSAAEMNQGNFTKGYSRPIKPPKMVQMETPRIVQGPVAGTVVLVPRPRPAVLVPAVGHSIRRIVLDAGHGGEDFGATYGGVKEKDLALEIVFQLKAALEAQGAEILLTRDRDIFIPLDERSKISNAARADLFVSIHANASTSPSLNGFEVYTLSEATDDAALALERAENSKIDTDSVQMQTTPDQDLKAIYWQLRETSNRKHSLRLAAVLSDTVAQALRPAAERLRTANFRVLKGSESPAVLVEIGYLSNDQDRAKLEDPLYKKELSDTLVKGILDFKKEYEDSDGFTI